MVKLVDTPAWGAGAGYGVQVRVLFWARYICGGTCYYDGYKIKGNILDTYDVECVLKQYFLKKSVEILFSTIDKKGDLKFLKESFCDDLNWKWRSLF